MRKKALITGAAGFVGKHLAKELEDSGFEVIKTARFSHLPFNQLKMNVLDYEKVYSVLHTIEPDYIFHLAAMAYVPSSWQDPELVLRVNLIGSLNLFNAVRSAGINSVIQIAGSSEEYGLVHEDEVPINENNPLRPLSPYGVSKVGMDLLAFQYFKSYGIRIVRTRAFNHEGWGRGQQYMPSGFAKQIVEIELGLREPIIYHGDLTSKRDITDVRDIVRAYKLSVEKCDPGEVYNIGSGNIYSAGDILEKLLKISGLKAKLAPDPKRMRPSDVKLLQCNPTKFKEKTGWEPKFTIDETLSEELEYWKERLNGGEVNKSTR